MKSGIFPNTPRIRIYWYVWIVLLSVAIILKFTVFLGATADEDFGLAAGYMLGTWLPLIILNMVEGRRLCSYMETHYSQQWDEISSMTLLGFPGRNGYKIIRWLYSENDFSDPVVARKKTEHREFVRLIFTVFLSYIPTFPILAT